MTWYVRIEPDEVSVDVREAGERMLDFVRRDLAFPDLSITWLRPETTAEAEERETWLEQTVRMAEIERSTAAIVFAHRSRAVFSDGPIWGFFRPFEPTTLWIRADVSAKRVGRTIAHEAEHARFFRSFTSGTDNGAAWTEVRSHCDEYLEARAWAYARHAVSASSAGTRPSEGGSGTDGPLRR